MKKSQPVVLKRVGQALAGFGLLFASALAFQNCSGYQMYDVTDSGDFSSSCPGCPSAIQLKTTIGGLDVLASDLTANREVDIGGYCDDADFPTSSIQYLDESSVWRDTGSGCNDLGRFHVKVPVPPSSVRQTFTLRLRMLAPVDSNPNQVTESIPVTVAP